MKRHIPNFLTILNLLSGTVGIVLVFHDHLLMASATIWLGGIFDFLDGFMARLLRVKSLIGKELDSLADMITFSLLPSFIVFHYLKLASPNDFIPYLSFSIAVFSALRLAKFNIDERQTSSFLGLPTPASAFLISSIPYYYESMEYGYLVNTTTLLFLTLFLSVLMVSEIRLFSFKLKGISWSNDKWKILLFLVSIVLIIWLNVLSIPLIILSYIIFSFPDNKKRGNSVE